MYQLLYQNEYSTEYEGKKYQKKFLVGESANGKLEGFQVPFDSCPELKVGDCFEPYYNKYGKLSGVRL